MAGPLSAQDQGHRRQDPHQKGGDRAVPRENIRVEPPRRQSSPEPERVEPRRESPPSNNRRADKQRRRPSHPSDEGRADQQRRRSQPPSSQGKARSRQHSPRDGYAVPYNRPHPRPHPQFGQYYRMQYQGRYYLWRPYPRPGRNVCIAGYWDWDWDWDPWDREWVPVWIQGYCNVAGYRPGPGFYFWFDFGR